MSYFEAKEEAYFWLSSAGEAARKKMFVSEEETRVQEEISSSADTTNELLFLEQSRMDKSIRDEFERIVSTHEVEKRQFKVLKSVNNGLAKGCSEAISRQLRTTLKSNDAPADRVTLFWEIKSSVDRFTDRKKAYDAKHVENLVKLQLFKRKAASTLLSMKSLETSLIEEERNVEVGRVSNRANENRDTWERQIETEGLRIEENYTEKITTFIQSFDREKKKMEIINKYSDTYRDNETIMAAKILLEVTNEQKSMYERHRGFQVVFDEYLASQDEASIQFYVGFGSMVKELVNDIDMQTVAVLVTQEGLFEAEQEVLKEKEIERFKQHKEADVIPVDARVMVGKITEEFCKFYLPSSPWIKYKDENSEHSYYYNTTSEDSVWENEFHTSEKFDLNEVGLFDVEVARLCSKVDTFCEARIAEIEEECESVKNQVRNFCFLFLAIFIYLLTTTFTHPPHSSLVFLTTR